MTQPTLLEEKPQTLKSDEFLSLFRTNRNARKTLEGEYGEMKRDICKKYGVEYDVWMTDADIIEMLLFGEPKEVQDGK